MADGKRPRSQQLDKSIGLLQARYGPRVVQSASAVPRRSAPPHVPRGFKQLDAITGCGGIPLSAITLKADVLGRTTSEERTRHEAASIHGTGMRMEYLIETLLDASSMDAGRFSVSKMVCDVESTLREVLELSSGSASPKGVRLLLRLPEHGLSVMADQDRLMQVLANLLGNAIRAAPAGGSVEVAAERTEEAIRFSVADKGPGIAPRDLAHVFERFWTSVQDGKKGTGLGLFIAKRIVEAHGGRIWADSDEHGTTFFFTLPSVEVPASTAAHPRPSGGLDELGASRGEVHPRTDDHGQRSHR